MKTKTITLLLFLFSLLSFAQANYELSTLRIGPFTLKMDVEQAEKIAGKKLRIDEKNNAPNHINYNGEIISLQIYEVWKGENLPNEKKIGYISTSSSKFRTKSGLGVGSTKVEVIEACKNFSGFSLYPGWNDDGSPNKSESNFNLTDVDANSVLNFKMKNNVVVEVSVFYDEGGC